MNINITAIPSLTDNYIWAVTNTAEQTTIIIDPGTAEPVLDFLATQGLQLQAILITHHHWDHVNGITAIKEQYDVPVYGPADENIPLLTSAVREGETVTIPGFPLHFSVLFIPGHTKGHIAYHSPGMVFCGDTLFAAGCGRLFEGTAEQMLTSLHKLSALPDDTNVYCAHEYTLRNLEFAELVEPGNKNIGERISRVMALRERGLPSLPSLMQDEKATNPFLRCTVPAVIASVEQYAGHSLLEEVGVFAALRKWKDEF